VAALPTTDETLFIPNTVAVVRNCPHPAEAELLYEYISDWKTSQRLVELHALEGATLPEATAATGLKVDWTVLLKNLETVTDKTKEIFLR
jgi:ABC-type Fe3+ transport system substrate-binding protein